VVVLCFESQPLFQHFARGGVPLLSASGTFNLRLHLTNLQPGRYTHCTENTKIQYYVATGYDAGVYLLVDYNIHRPAAQGGKVHLRHLSFDML
jgi:hypothetical protein